MPLSQKYPALLLGNAAVCPRCGHERPTQLRATNSLSDLDWLQCVQCDHMWAVQREPRWFAEDGFIGLRPKPDRRQKPDRRKTRRGNRRA